MEIRNLRVINAGTLAARFDLYFPNWKVTFKDYSLIRSSAGEFINPPSSSYEKDGKKKWNKYIIFDEDVARRFESKVMELLKEAMNSQPEIESNEVPF